MEVSAIWCALKLEAVDYISTKLPNILKVFEKKYWLGFADTCKMWNQCLNTSSLGFIYFLFFPTGNSLGRNPTKLSGLETFTWKKLASLTTLSVTRCARRFVPPTLLALLLPKDPDVPSTSTIPATLGKDCRSGFTTAACQWSLPEHEPSLSQPFPWCF